MKKNSLIMAACMLTIQWVNAQPNAPKPDAKMNGFISSLMGKMTIEEKIGQLNLPSIGFDVTGPLLSQGVEEKIEKGLVGGVFNSFTPIAIRKLQDLAMKTRLKIPLLFGFDVIHGHKTIFPIPLGLSCSWDTVLIQKTARIAAIEASADGLNWTFSPMVDIARDPRWGRVSEGAGEDPFLGSAIGKAMVQGYQGGNLAKDNTIMACVKHFALYGAAEAGRDYNTVDMSRIKMYQYYLPPYKAAIDAGAATVMTSFNEIDGIPASANKWLMTDLLRNQWGFKGFVVTDYTAINEMIQHGIGDLKKVSEKAINAGVDMDMVGEGYLENLQKLWKEGKVNIAAINAACRRMLEAKYKLGLFEDPYKYINDSRATTEIMSADKLLASKEAAIKSMVLLKNANQTLPLAPNQKIAFIGPLVKDKRNLIGNWSGAGDYKKAISIWDALPTQSPNNYTYAKGCNLLDDTLIINKLNPHGADIILDAKTPQQLIDEAVALANNNDLIVAALGEPFGMSGEAASRADIGLPPNQQALLKALYATGKPIVLVLMNGRPLTLNWENKNCAAILETWYAGTNAGPAISDVLFGKANPSGRLTMSFPYSVGQIPVYYNHKNTGRPMDENQKYTSKYLDIPNEPLFPFGFGLSYSNFSYANLQLSKTNLNGADILKASISVTNNGKMDGEETVQLYITDPVASVTRSVKELKGFKKLALKQGETKAISFTITPELLKFYNTNLQYDWEGGAFIIHLGANSNNLQSAKIIWNK